MADTQVILIVASAGNGKTTKVKKITEGRPCIVYDPTGEYDHLEWDVNLARSRYYNSDYEKFIELCNTKHGGTICVFEEATSFLEGATGKKMKELITKRRHPLDKGGRNIVLVFHTVNTIPPFLLDNANFIILGKTGESFERIKRKKPELYKVAMYVKQAPKYTFVNYKNI